MPVPLRVVSGCTFSVCVCVCWRFLGSRPIQVSEPCRAAEIQFAGPGIWLEFCSPSPVCTAKHRVYYVFWSPDPKNPQNLRWPGDSYRRFGAIHVNQFVRIDSQQKPQFSQRASDTHESPITCDLQLSGPWSVIRKKGVQPRNDSRIRRFARICDLIRANRAI